MKTTISLSMIGVGIGLLAVPCRAASPVDDVKNAAAKLAEQSSYSWTTKVEQVQTNRFRGGPADGQTEKTGFTVLTFKGGNNNSTTVAVRKGEKVAIKQDDEWKTAEELAEGDGGGGGRFGRGGFLLGRVQRTKLPAEDAQELLGRVKELKKDDDGSYSGELTPEGVKAMFTFGGGGRGGGRGQGGGAGAGGAGADGANNRPGGRGGMDTSRLKVHAKFWLKDGMLAKYESKTEGKAPGFNFNRGGGGGEPPRDVDMGQTRTVEIHDIGSTKAEVPAEARKKLAR